MECNPSGGIGTELAALTVATLVVGSIGGAAVLGVDTARAASDETNVVEGTPDLNASAPDARLSPGQDGTIGITLTNDATIDDNNGTHPEEARRRAGEARSVEVSISDTRTAPITVETGEQAVGTIQDGQSSGPHTFDVHVDEDAEAGTYTIEVTTEYRHAERVEYEERADGNVWYNETVVDRTETETVTVVIEPEARFDVTAVDHDVPLGGEGIVSVEVTNTGDENVTESTVSLTSTDSDFYFGSGTASSEAEVGPWKAGETKRLRFRAGTVEAAVNRSYPIDVAVSFTNSDDNQRRVTDQVGIRPHERTRFEVVSVEHDVPEGGEGTMTVEISHTAGKPIEDVAVTASTSESEVYLGSEGSRSARSMVGAWSPGETRHITFRVGTTENAVDRSYPIDLEFEYTDDEDNENSRTAFVEFRPKERAGFEIASVNHDVPQNGEGTVTIVADLLEDEDVSDVSVTARTTESEMYIGSEGSRSATAVIREWPAGEQEALTFRVGTTENAVNRSYPIEVTFEYTDDADNENTHTEYVEIKPKARDRFGVELVEHDVPENGEGTLTIEIDRTATKNVSDVSVTLSTRSSEVYIGSASSRSETAVVGQWGADETNRFTFRVGTSENAIDRTYPLEVALEYTDADDNQNSQTEVVEFSPGGRDRFRIETVDHDVPLNGEGTMAVEVTHTGDDPISDVAITATTPASEVYLGAEASRSSTAYVAEWAPNETRQLTFRTGTNDDAVNRTYPVDLNFDYTDAANSDNERTETVEFVPTDRKRFRVQVVDHDVSRNGEGTLTVRLAHLRRNDISDVSVTASTAASEVYLGSESSRSARSIIGTFNGKEATELTFRIGTSENAVERPYPIELNLEYTDDDDNDNQRTKFVEFTPRDDDQFEVEDVDHDVSQNGEGTLTVAVEYTGNKEISDVTVTGSTTDPDVYMGGEGSRSSETLVDDWDPGDTRRLTFRVGTTEDAVDRAYPLELSLDYTDDADNHNQETEQFTFTPRNRDHFTVEGVDHDVPTDGEGTVLVAVTHTGNEPIEDVTVTASTAESEVYLGASGSRSAKAMVGTWGPGETRRLTFRVGTENVVERTYPLELAFDYTDTDDNDNRETRYVEFVPRDEEYFRVESVEHDVPRNGVGTVTVEIAQTATKNVSDVTITASTSESEIYLGSESSRSGTSMVGEWDANETRRLTFRVGTTENAVRRSYPLQLQFDFTDDADNEYRDAEYVAFEPRGRPNFAVESVDSNVPIAGTGIVELTLKNEGPTNASEATLSISSPVNAVFFGSGSSSEPIEARGFVIEQPRTATPNSQAYVGDWPVGETRTVYFRAGFESNAISRKYPADITISYENGDGNDMPDQSRSIGIEPRPNQTFEFELVESNLYVGEDGSLVGRITNAGNRTADGLVVTVENQRENVDFYTTRYAIGTLEPGKSATFHFRVGVTGETEHGPRLFELSARYRDPQDNVRQTDTQDLAVDIHPDRDTFGLETERVTFSPGSSGKLVVTVTNRRNETLTDIQAKLFTDDPLDSSDDSAFIPELEPGESKNITLDVSVAGSASEKTYSASMDFRFDNARGDGELSDTYRVPVTVEKSGGGHDIPILFGVFATFLGATAVGWRFEAPDRGREWYREQFGD